MGSEDYLDAFERLIKLKLAAKQDREFIRVALDCLLQSNCYNPYFSVLAVQLCKHDHNHKFTLQYALWDRFKAAEELTVPQMSLLARFVAHLVAKHALSLSVLKVVEFNSLTGPALTLHQLLLLAVLTEPSESEVQLAVDRICTSKQFEQLRHTLLIFLRHYVRSATFGIGEGGEGATTKEQKQALLARRYKLAKRCLNRAEQLL